MTGNLGASRCTFATSERINTRWMVCLCQDPDSVGFLVRMLQKAINLLLFLLPFIFGQEAEFFGCCMFKEVQGTWMMVDRYGDFKDAGNDDGTMARMKTRVKTWMAVEALMM